MLPGFSGSLVSEYFAEELLAESFSDELDPGGARAACARLRRQRAEAADCLGPVCGARQVHDLVAGPLVAVLGFDPPVVRGDGRAAVLVASLRPGSPAGGTPPTPAAGAHAPPPALLVTTAWAESLDAVWRDAVRASLAASAAWCLCVNGPHIRLLDIRRSYARRFLQFELEAALADESVFAVLWTLLRAASLVPGQSPDRSQALLARVIDASDRSAVRVCRSLRDGVLQALSDLLAALVLGGARKRLPAPARLHEIHQQALTIIYRILFLFFAESRRLVPSWHPLYRESYSLEAARALAEQPGPARGLWETLQAIARLSHAGCEAGDLKVAPFNGRLFSPSATPLGESPRPGDETARRMLLALSTARGPRGRARISYRDLDVEQLGAVYESVLDFVPRVAGGSVALEACGSLRKATGTFYTPRSLTTYLVRHTLSPLVADATPERILSLRVVDPAMGSGAFLVAACRFLASAYESALVRTGGCLAADVDEADRRRFRRAVAQHCLYGVDVNPMAVQLGRLSLWLATLAPDRPLSFLDHRLVVGDSLVGASPGDVLARPPSGSAKRALAPLPLFGEHVVAPDLALVVPRRASCEQPDDTIDVVRGKEAAMASLSGRQSPLAGWKAVLDLWCAQAFVGPRDGVAHAGVFASLSDHLLTGRSALPAREIERHLGVVRGALGDLKPLHWALEFPEVFYAADGSPLENAGFDAVVGNPPWDVLPAASRLLRFARASGVYRAQGDGHRNCYQLFVERALQLARTGGRVGLIVPWGLAADHNCAELRRLLFDHASIESLVAFDNAARIFPIHRSLRFVAFTATKGGRTAGVAARIGERDPGELDQIPPGSAARLHYPIVFSRAIIERLSGDRLAIPAVRREVDLRLLDKLSHAAPALGAASGWNADFGRELNASDDRRHFVPRGRGLPVLDGKHVEPFRAWPQRAERAIAESAASTLLGARSAFSRARLAYRDVSSSTNRLTLIAARVPAGCVTVHTLFCLRTPLPPQAQFFLSAILNSFVANYFVRFFVSTHVTTAILSRLPVPRPDAASPSFRRIAWLAARLEGCPDALGDARYPLVQALVAREYGLDESDLAAILQTFPLVDPAIGAAALSALGGFARKG